MHKINIEVLQKEALRLIDIEIELLQSMLSQPGVISEAHLGQTQTFDKDSTEKYIEVLSGEQTKLENLEMVLAVVGTMKAGKSTSINAIVGTEVLPNRNRPMTALPTLIRHTSGQIEPVLKFENSQPINHLLELLRVEIERPEHKSTLNKLEIDADIKELITSLKNGILYKKEYHGADSIFDFLKGLNDLVRLCREIDVDFPFSDYDEIHELPVIEVEFAHLREMENTSGRLTLLDTPGPNESGQIHLRKMLREQLSKASAVLAILDFTQLKSDADAEVRKELNEIANVSEGRLYTLVNKFDQKDRHSDTEDEVKRFVAESLMEGCIRAEDVFPVSSRWAYLANRARHELFINKKLPNQKKQPWVADFGEEAFGRRWESKIENPEEVKESADQLWNDSLFYAPLEGVIQIAYARASSFAVDAAAAKLVDIAESIDKFLTTRETALTRSVKVLQSQINELQQDISKVEASESKAKQSVEKMLGALSDGTKQVFEKVKSDAFGALKIYFREGKQIERENHEKLMSETQKKTPGHRGFGSIIRSFLNSTPKILQSNRSDFDPSDPVMRFVNINDARNLVKRIEGSVSQIILSAETTMKSAMTKMVEEFQKDFSDSVLLEAQSIIDSMKARLNDDGFLINLTLPSASKLSLNFTGSDMLADVIGEKTEKVTRRRRKDSAWGTVCSWFNTDDWGWEEYTTTNQYYEVDIRKINKSTESQIDRAFSGLDTSVVTYIKKPINDGINEFFTGFRRTVEQIRGDLLQSIRDQEQSKTEQMALSKHLSSLKKNLPDILEDSRAIKSEISKQLHPVSRG